MNIDILIVAVFLSANLILGIYSGRGIKNIKEYAVGDRNFSTATLSATLIATWISGSYFTVCISQSYTEGIWFVPAVIAEMFSLIIVGYIFSPRVKEFFGNISVAETMGNLYGKKIRIITAIASLAQAIGMIALQIKVFSTIFSYFWNFSALYATAISSCIVIFYSAWGGIRSVTFTDVLQFITFGAFIPLFFLFVLKVFGDVDILEFEFHNNPLLDYTQLVNWQNPKFLPSLFMFVWFLVPDLSSTAFQRILMAKSTKQIKSAFGIAAIGFAIILLLACAIGIIILSVNHKVEGIDADNIVVYILNQYNFDGLKGFTMIGIIAMVMSTADSWINTGAVIFAHDLCKPLGIKVKNELVVSRIFAVIVGVISLLLVLFNHNIFALFTLQSSCYMPVVTIPLILTILGFRSSGKAVLFAMLSGASCVALWNIYVPDINGVFPGMMVNAISLFGYHYLFNQPGGWVGIKDDSDIKQLKMDRARKRIKWNKIFTNLWDINFIDHCKKYVPKYEINYTYFAITVIICTTVIMLNLEMSSYNSNLFILFTISTINFLISSSFLFHKLWPVSFKQNYIGFIWYISIFITLCFNTTLLSMMSDLSDISMLILVINLFIIGTLLTWKSTISIIVVGVYAAYVIYSNYVGTVDLSNIHNSNFRIACILFAMSGILITFLKSRQDREGLVEEINDHLQSKMNLKNIELYKALELKHEFLRNLEHEAHTPITGITSMGQLLWENYDQLSDKQRKQAAEDIAMSSIRLQSLVNNLIDLSKLSSLQYDLKKQEINLSELVENRLEACKRMYFQADDIEFDLDLGENISVLCDEYYIGTTLDNLILNAMQYGQKKKVSISVKKSGGVVEFKIKDQGIGIPPKELYDIFGTFVTSSKTSTPAGGRGVGLALCKRVIELHNGKIWAESTGENGASFYFNISS